MIELYYAAPSIYGRKVLAVLDEKNLDYTIKSIAWGDNEKEEYLKLNPNGEIPLLVDDGEVVYESTAMIEYLNDEYPEPSLMPEASADRARVRMVEDFCDLHFYKSLIKCVMMIRKGEELTAELIQRVANDVSRLNDYLGKQEYIAGKYSLADCAVMAGLASIEKFGLIDKVGVSSSLKLYWDRLKRKPGYKGASLFEIKEELQKA